MEYILRENNVCLESVRKNQMQFQHNEEHAKVAFLDDYFSLYDTLRSKDASKWEAAMQEEYHSLMADNL